MSNEKGTIVPRRPAEPECRRRTVERREVLAGLAAGAFGSNAQAAGKAPTRLLDACEPLTGLSFDDAERTQMSGAVEEIMLRARRIAQTPIENAIAPAELFDPRLPGWTPQLSNCSAMRMPNAPSAPQGRDDIAFAPAWRLSAWIARRELTCRDLTEIYLARIAERAAPLFCVATLLADRARAEADKLDRELEREKWRGPLHGLPYGLKDLVDTAGVRTAWGAEPYKDRIPEFDAVIVKRLRDAGAVLLAKTSCGAIAYGDVWYEGRTRNPWNLSEGSSGSSAGSAAASPSTRMWSR